MDCHECLDQGERQVAVGLCRTCMVGLCQTHMVAAHDAATRPLHGYSQSPERPFDHGPRTFAPKGSER